MNYITTKPHFSHQCTEDGTQKNYNVKYKTENKKINMQ